MINIASPPSVSMLLEIEKLVLDEISDFTPPATSMISSGPAPEGHRDPIAKLLSSSRCKRKTSIDSVNQMTGSYCDYLDCDSSDSDEEDDHVDEGENEDNGYEDEVEGEHEDDSLNDNEEERKGRRRRRRRRRRVKENRNCNDLASSSSSSSSSTSSSSSSSPSPFPSPAPLSQELSFFPPHLVGGVGDNHESNENNNEIKRIRRRRKTGINSPDNEELLDLETAINCIINVDEGDSNDRQPFEQPQQHQPHDLHEPNRNLFNVVDQSDKCLQDYNQSFRSQSLSPVHIISGPNGHSERDNEGDDPWNQLMDNSDQDHGILSEGCETVNMVKDMVPKKSIRPINRLSHVVLAPCPQKPCNPGFILLPSQSSAFLPLTRVSNESQLLMDGITSKLESTEISETK